MRKTVSLLLLSAMLAVAGCESRQGEEIRQKEQAETESSEADTEVSLMGSEEKSKNVLREYYALLMTTNEQEDIYRFLEEHVDEAEKKDADQLVNGLLGYLADADAADYNRLSRQEQYLTEEMRDFIELMRREQNSPAISDDKVLISLSDLLLRAKGLEEHARAYPEGVTYLYAYEKFCELVNAAVTGFYDGAADYSCCYLDIDQKHIEEAALVCYKEFIEAYPDTHLADILREYVALLEQNGRTFDKSVKKFYGNIYTVIKENFSVRTE